VCNLSAECLAVELLNSSLSERRAVSHVTELFQTFLLVITERPVAVPSVGVMGRQLAGQPEHLLFRHRYVTSAAAR